MRFQNKLFILAGCVGAALLASPYEASAQNGQVDVGRDILSPIFNGIGGALNNSNNNGNNSGRPPGRYGSPNAAGNGLIGGGGNSFNDGGWNNGGWNNRPSNGGWNNRPNSGNWDNGDDYYYTTPTPRYSTPQTYVRPAPTLPLPPSEPIVLQNPSHTNTIVHYKLNGSYSYTMQSGHSQTLGGDRRWTIDFQRGGTYGSKQYALEPGKTYRFKGTAQGWELVASNSSSEVAGTPAIPLPPIE